MNPFSRTRPQADASLSEIATVLANERRCLVIDALGEVAPIALDQFADRLAERCYGAGFTNQQRKRIYISLYQTHREVLTDVGVITVDHREWGQGPQYDAYAGALDALADFSERDQA